MATYRGGVTTTEAAALSIESLRPPPAPTPGPRERLATLLGQRVSGPAAVAVASLITAAGVAVDLPGDPSLALGTEVAVVLGGLVATCVVRLRSLATPAVLPPLLVTAASLTLAVLGGRNDGSREIVLDLGTTLALSAPLVFGATAACLAVVLVRVGRHLLQRRG